MRQFNLINEICTFPDENVSGAFREKKNVHNGAATCSEWFSVGCYSVAKVFREDF